MARKEDLRVRKTKKAIAEAFMALLEEKNYDEITVNELCDRAGVRRTTFYKHYKDKLFKTPISRGVKLSEAPGFGMPVYYHDKNCKGTAEYMAVAKELLGRI